MKTPTDTWQRYWDGEEEAKAELIEAYYPLAKYVAIKASRDLPSMVDTDDIISHGVLGLIDALGKFDPEKGVKFETYAITRIRGSILDELRASDWVPRSVRANARKVERARVQLERSLGRKPTVEEIATETEMTTAQIATTINDVYESNFAALDSSIISGDGVITLKDAIQDRLNDPEEVATSLEVRDLIAAAMKALDERERAIIALHYLEGLTLADIGKIIGVTESRVCQMHTRAILGLQGVLAGT